MPIDVIQRRRFNSCNYPSSNLAELIHFFFYFFFFFQDWHLDIIKQNLPIFLKNSTASID